jgi:tetratricopeptide (TPR) repeat protein
VVGLDENLGLLYIQDPMSHVTREEPIRSETQLGSLFRNAALVALRKDDSEKKARLTAAGVVDAEHVRLVDAVEDPALRKEPKKRLEMLEKAIGLCEDYPLAWSKRVRTLWASGATRDQMLAAIRKARVRYPHLEFSHQVHAQFLFEEDRYEEAIIELDAAQRLDRWDANNFQREAECHQYLGRMKEAVDVYWKALGLDPSHVRATENLASLALEAKERALAEHLSSCALDMAPKNPFNHLTSAKLVEIRPDHAEDDWREVVRRARAGFELDPEHPSLRMKLGNALAELADEASRNEAIEIFQATIKKYPKWLDALKATATALERAERIDEAITVIVEAIEVVTVPPIELVKMLLPLLGDRGRDDEVLRWTGRAIERFPASAELKVIELDWLYDHDRYDPGFARTKEVAAKAPKDFFYQLKVAKWLGDQPATRSQAVDIFRASLEATPSFPWRRGRLMKLLALEPEEAIAVAKAEPKPSRALLAQQASLEIDVGRFDDAVATLKRARELGGSPDSEEYDHWIRATLAQGTVEEALARLADSPADVFTWRSRAVLLSELGRHDEALDLLRRQPDDDYTARETLRRLTRKDEHYRDELERRTRLLLGSPKITRSSRAYWRGVLAGSRASRGEREEWERILATEPSSERVDYLDRALVAPRHRALMAEVNHAIATRFPRDQAVGYHAHDASTRGDREGAVRIYREALDRCPTTRYFIPCMGEELLLLGRDHEVEALHDDLRRGGSSGFGVLAIARLLRGERESAIELANRGDRLRISWGAAADDHVMTQAALATLRGDTARIDALRTMPSQHFDPESPLWSRLTKLATETT